jgi:hypothetical protein
LDNARRWTERMAADPCVQAFRRAKAQAEAEGADGPIRRFVNRLAADLRVTSTLL